MNYRNVQFITLITILSSCINPGSRNEHTIIGKDKPTGNEINDEKTLEQDLIDLYCKDILTKIDLSVTSEDLDEDDVSSIYEKTPYKDTIVATQQKPFQQVTTFPLPIAPSEIYDETFKFYKLPQLNPNTGSINSTISKPEFDVKLIFTQGSITFKNKPFFHSNSYTFLHAFTELNFNISELREIEIKKKYFEFSIYKLQPQLSDANSQYIVKAINKRKLLHIKLKMNLDYIMLDFNDINHNLPSRNELTADSLTWIKSDIQSHPNMIKYKEKLNKLCSN